MPEKEKNILTVGGDKMAKQYKIIGIGVLVVFMAFAFSGSLWAAEAKTIVGTVNDDGMIVDEKGVIYEIAEGDMSDEIAEKTGEKIEVKGMVEESDGGNMTIMIESYKVVE